VTAVVGETPLPASNGPNGVTAPLIIAHSAAGIAM
jgi:hypothetical protein